jgi:hypothetical protein
MRQHFSQLLLLSTKFFLVKPLLRPLWCILALHCLCCAMPICLELLPSSRNLILGFSVFASVSSLPVARPAATCVCSIFCHPRDLLSLGALLSPLGDLLSLCVLYCHPGGCYDLCSAVTPVNLKSPCALFWPQWSVITISSVVTPGICITLCSGIYPVPSAAKAKHRLLPITALSVRQLMFTLYSVVSHVICYHLMFFVVPHEIFYNVSLFMTLCSLLSLLWFTLTLWSIATPVIYCHPCDLLSLWALYSPFALLWPLWSVISLCSVVTLVMCYHPVLCCHSWSVITMCSLFLSALWSDMTLCSVVTLWPGISMCSVVTPVICYHPVFCHLPCTLCCQGKSLFIANNCSKLQATDVRPALFSCCPVVRPQESSLKKDSITKCVFCRLSRQQREIWCLLFDDRTRSRYSRRAASVAFATLQLQQEKFTNTCTTHHLLPFTSEQLWLLLEDKQRQLKYG